VSSGQDGRAGRRARCRERLVPVVGSHERVVHDLPS